MQINKKNNLIPVIVILFMGFFIQSCDKIPIAAFTYEPPNGLIIGDTVYFTNYSENASTYEWDFGNGESSTEESPFIIYDNAAFYTVVLNAFSKAGSDTVSHVVDINYPTVLGFFVYEPDSTTLLADCEVWIYDNEEDFMNSAEPLYSEITDVDGVVVFENLEGITYYATLFKETSDGLYIRNGYTNPLELYAINLYAIVMEYVPGGQMKSYRENSMKKASNISFPPVLGLEKEKFRF